MNIFVHASWAMLCWHLTFLLTHSVNKNVKCQYSVVQNVYYWKCISGCSLRYGISNDFLKFEIQLWRVAIFSFDDHNLMKYIFLYFYMHRWFVHQKHLFGPVLTQHVTVAWHERHGVSNHQTLARLFNNLLRLTTKETSKFYITGGDRWLPSQRAR